MMLGSDESRGTMVELADLAFADRAAWEPLGQAYAAELLRSQHMLSGTSARVSWVVVRRPIAESVSLDSFRPSRRSA